ncbi:MAG: head-tail adaptor protein [Pelagimonas sp.]|jgi:head-tail adaptor|nr:head-tail adaptor protein [Pelagimonas sp.]
MSAPRLNRPLTLEAPTRSADGAGGYAETWTELGVLWAELDERTGRLDKGEGATFSDIAFRITVRAAPVGASNRPVAGQRFRMNARLFRIDAVSETGANGFFLICSCHEEVAV